MECETIKGMITSDVYVLATFLSALTIANLIVAGKLSKAFMEAKRMELQKHTNEMLVQLNKIGKPSE